MKLTHLKANNKDIYTAYYTAVSDMVANIKPYIGGALGSEKEVIIAGIGYEIPWTRDTAINVSNAGYLFPEISENTLMSVLKNENGKYIADGSYGQDWDSIIWVIGAWNMYLYNGDTEFLKNVYNISKESVQYFEEKAFSDKLGLFRGPACYGDGIAAYPDVYAKHGQSGILSCVGEGESGTAIDMYSLSTNCIYYKVYKLIDKMAECLGNKKEYETKAEALKEKINTHFWNDEKGYYNYVVDDFGGSDYFEGMGNAFAILFGVADIDKAERIFKSHPASACGMPCVYPSFERYTADGEYGRHSGTVWPHIQSFWADASMKYGKCELFDKEFNMLTKCAVRDGHFSEIYHPVTSLPYGGMQEDKGEGIRLWDAEKKQTWSATGYLHMIFTNIIGFEFEPDGIRFNPYMPDGVSELELSDFNIRNTNISVSIKGTGRNVKSFKVNGIEKDNKIKYTDGNDLFVEIELG